MNEITTKIGDITTAVTEGIIIQQVNAQGVMGSGVAAVIRKKWPTVYHTYIGYINGSDMPTINLMGVMIPVQVSATLHVCNIVGQHYYGRDGKRYTSYDALDDGLKKVKSYANALNITQIHFPLIGCGLGGGEWEIVSAIIKANLYPLELTLWTIEPNYGNLE